MPLYHYEAIDSQGHNTRGSMTVESELALERALRDAGLWLVDVTTTIQDPTSQATSADFGLFPLSGKPLRRALIDFCTLMNFQVRAGVPLVQALESISRQHDKPQFGKVLAAVQQRIESGDQFHEALAAFPHFFSKEIVGMVRAGECSGNLARTLVDLKTYLVWVDKVIREARSATLYPAIVLTVISCFVLGLFTFIVPRFATLLTKLNVPLPLVTQIVFGVSDFAKKTWWIWLLALVGGIVGVRLGRRYSPDFAWAVDRIKLRLPLFGDLIGMLALARFAQNFSALYGAGIPVLQSLEMCRGLVGNLVVSKAVATVARDISEGSTFFEAINRNNLFPPILVRMISVGETTGNLEAAIQEVADYYNQIIPERVKRLLTILEPLLMVGLVGIVLVVALSIYMPLISLMGNIR